MGGSCSKQGKHREYMQVKFALWAPPQYARSSQKTLSRRATWKRVAEPCDLRRCWLSGGAVTHSLWVGVLLSRRPRCPYLSQGSSEINWEADKQGLLIGLEDMTFITHHYIRLQLKHNLGIPQKNQSIRQIAACLKYVIEKSSHNSFQPHPWWLPLPLRTILDLRLFLILPTLCRPGAE